MDPSQPAGSRRRTTAIIAAAGLACLAIAVPVSGAFGADDSGTNGAAAQQGGQGYGPQGYGPAPRPDGDCPKERQGHGNSGSDSSGTALPDDSVAS